MLEKIDLSREIGKEEYKEAAAQLQEWLGALQRSARSAGIPILIIFEGWEASGKGTLMNELILPLDPRGFRVHHVHSEDDNPLGRFWPPMRRFWYMSPPKGTIAIFSRSWYRLIMDSGAAAADPATCESIASFERTLARDGALIIKFFLHISKKEQKKRLRKLDEGRASTWRVNEKEWAQNDGYEAMQRLFEEMIQRTDRDCAPWTIVEAEGRRFATLKILTSVARNIEQVLRRKSAGSEPREEITPAPPGKTEFAADKVLTPSVLKNLDLGKRVDEREYREMLPKYQERLREAQYELYGIRRPMVIVFEGQDAAGKGGCIKRLTQRLDPRGYQVSPTSAPNDAERAHHYLRRFWDAFPKAGHIGIFDRSWYGRILVERVESFAPEHEWRRAYEEINEMEEQWVRYGCILVKFWLQIDPDEQLRRFEERQRNPEKTWKITDEDWRNREKWPLYEEAAEEMMLRTSTTFAPWTIIEANDKYHARIKVLEHTLNAASKAMGL